MNDTSVGIVKENLTRIKGSFATLVTKVTDKLKGKAIDMKRFRLYILNLFPPGDIIADSLNLEDIFEIISRHRLCDHSPIEEIADEFGGDDSEMKMWFISYKSELTGFKATTRLIDYIKACKDDKNIAESTQTIQQNMARYDSRYCHKLTIKLKARVTQTSLLYIDQFWRSVADHFLLPCLSVLLDSIEEGCVEVTWLVPTLFAVQIQGNIQDSAHFLQLYEVIQVMMDQKILYDEEGMDTVS